VILGKTQMTEGAFSDHHPAIRVPTNPWNAAYWPGISSSGSGIAIAAGLCFGAIGSDTGGSIRWPSAANGITGLKPTWGRVSRHGALELAASLDHLGPMARSVADVAILLQAMAGPDRKDPTALLDPVPDYLAACRGDLGGLRIAIDPAWASEDVDPPTHEAVSAAIEILRGLGARIVEIRFPDVASVVADSIGHLGVEAAVAHEATYPRLKDQYGPVFAGALEIGRGLSASDYQKILLRRAEFRGRVDAALAGVDLLLTPVQPQAPLTLDAVGVMGARPDFVGRLARFTYPFDATGHPTLTLPGGADADGMPVGIQLVGQRLGEPTLLKAGAAFQRVTDWHRRRPAT
jgi:amidase